MRTRLSPLVDISEKNISMPDDEARPRKCQDIFQEASGRRRVAADIADTSTSRLITKPHYATSAARLGLIHFLLCYQPLAFILTHAMRFSQLATAMWAAMMYDTCFGRVAVAKHLSDSHSIKFTFLLQARFQATISQVKFSFRFPFFDALFVPASAHETGMRARFRPSRFMASPAKRAVRRRSTGARYHSSGGKPQIFLLFDAQH